MKRLALPTVLAVLTSAAGARAQDVRGFAGDRFDFVRALEPVITGPTDQRFFGTFCQAAPKKFCKSIPILPDPCKTLRDTFVRMDHITMTDGGLLQGKGRFVLDGDPGRVGVGGRIVRRGRARIAATIPGMETQVTVATLSSDGLELTASIQNRSLALRKDACGNRAPVVSLSAPFGPTFPFGQSIMLVGHIDDEDTSFPVERQVFTSNRQGLIPGTRMAGGRTLFTTALQPGPHRVTFTLTDSGGLTSQASLDLTVTNHPPDPPRIFLPVAGATLFAGAPVLLQGTAFDPEMGLLSGAALTWTAQLAPGGPFQPLGTGSEVETSFAAPADPVRIRLTASDGTGTSQTERQVRVLPSTGNAPPVVVIREPDRRLSPAAIAIILIAGQQSHFVAEASDVESAGPDLQVRWEFTALQGPGGSPHPAPPVPNPPPVTGTLATDVTFPVAPSDSLYYRVTFTATDAGGVSSSDSIEIWVSSAGVIL